MLTLAICFPSMQLCTLGVGGQHAGGTRRHCIQLENCCYGYNGLMVRNMVKDGFGEIAHGACAYNRDLRSIVFSKEGEGLWRRFEHFMRTQRVVTLASAGL